MIQVTRLNGEGIVINAHLIESIEATPDTMISLTTGHKMMVKESMDQVIDRVVGYEGSICCSNRAAHRAHLSASHHKVVEEE
jgi:flagellar protein FlbD